MRAADWPQFRGPGNNGVAADAALPTRWGEGRNIAWKAELPGRGPSSPIVVGPRVLLTATSGFRHDRLHVLCFDAATGRLRWERRFWATGRTATHGSISGAAPTPASDGQCVYAFFSSNDLICLDLDGNLRWYRGLGHDYPKAGNDVGMAASPALGEGAVVVQVESQGDSFAAAIGCRHRRDALADRPSAAGQLVLAGDSAGRRCSARGRPAAIARRPGRARLADRRTAVAADRELRRRCSSLCVGNRLYVPLNGLTALTLGDGNQAPQVLWEANRLSPGPSSPVIAGGRIYTVAGSIVKCGDAETGKAIWQLRLKGQHWATPVVAGQHLYCLNQDGEARVVKLGDEQGEIVAEHNFGATLHASPAVADNALYVRSDKYLWKIQRD